MITTTFRRQVAAIVCTVLMSSACVLSAVGPAQAGAAPTVGVANTIHLVA